MNRSHLVRSLALVGLFAACASKPPPDAHRPVEEEALDLHGAAKDDAGSSTPSSTS